MEENKSYCFGCTFFDDESFKCTNPDGKLNGITLTESLAESEHDCEVFEEVRYCLTPQGLLYLALDENNVDVPFTKVKNIFNRFMELMVKHDYIEAK